MQFYSTDVRVEGLEGNKIIEVQVNEKTIALSKKGNKINAFAATCPHAGARFCEGWLDPLGKVVCPLHKYKFDPGNGYNVTGEGYKLKTYAVEIKDGVVWVQL